MSSRALRSRRVVTPDGVLDRVVMLKDGIIVDVIPHTAVPEAVVVEDRFDAVIMPGLVDTHVHVNEPGRTEWEGFVTATKAAAAGGITTIVDMPLNCIPVTTTLAALEEKLDAITGKLWVDAGFYGGVVPHNTAELEPLIQAGVTGFKAFLIHSGIDDFPHVTEADLRKAMPILAQGRMPLLVHAELDCQGHDLYNGDARQYQHYLASRPGQWETDAIELMIRLCRETGCRVHIVHLSCAEALPMIQQAKSEGLPLTVETCPHYLALWSEAVPDGDTRYKCAPPIREQANRDQLWEGLKSGIIDFVVSDHSPCTPELKLLDQGDFKGAWGGIASLQFGLPVVWTEARERGHTLLDMARWMCKRTARFGGLAGRKGVIAPGYEADLVIWDPDARFTVTPEIIQHRHKVTPYNGRTLYGEVQETILRGQTVYSQGNVSAQPLGQPILHAVHAGVP